jgi:transcriptional regulator with XRE-family HTH domain
LGFTQEQLAVQLGVARRTIVNHETEFHPVSLDVLNKLEELGADCFYILFGRRHLEFSVPMNPALLEKVLGWADVLCRDRKGRPFPQGHIARFISEAYAYLASEESEIDDEAKVEMALAKIARRAA